jgi:hypothetical protein
MADPYSQETWLIQRPGHFTRYHRAALKTAEFDHRVAGGGILPGSSPGLGIAASDDLVGDPDMTSGD